MFYRRIFYNKCARAERLHGMFENISKVSTKNLVFSSRGDASIVVQTRELGSQVKCKQELEGVNNN